VYIESIVPPSPSLPRQAPLHQADIAPPAPPVDEYHDDIIYPDTIPFVLVHVVCLGAIWSGVTATAVAIGIALYVTRMFGTTAGYHRYFSHRTFRTSRVGQFLLAVLAQSSSQRGVLWWAAKHRHHHQHSDTEHDVHSPRQRGFLYAHVGWIFQRQQGDTDYAAIPDLARYPELVWLNRHPYLPPTALAVACFLVAGWPGLIVGFFWSTVVLFHGTFCINSLAHVHGKQRYVTGDDSRNNWWLAIITLGEGWHNNHHAYQRSTRQGFRWYEWDPTYYLLKTLSWTGLVWDLGAPPADVLRNEHRLGRAVVEKVARQVAAGFTDRPFAARVREAWACVPGFTELRARVAAGQVRAEEMLAEMHLPHLPTLEQIRARAESILPDTSSMDEIVARARELILQAVSVELQATATTPGTA
jgi:stearoyl-CoA desaturase (delta-9 desaturase)